MDHLKRDLAPITPIGWHEITEEADRVLRQRLTARKLIEFDSTGSWDTAAYGTGRVSVVTSPTDDVMLLQRTVLPLLELRTNFSMLRSEFDALDRGASDFDTDPVIQAAMQAAAAEDQVVFHGLADTGTPGVAALSAHDTHLVSHESELPAVVSNAVETIRDSGVQGPYALALSRELWTAVMGGTEKGYPTIAHLKMVVDGPILWAPTLQGAVVLSQRGGDFSIYCGQDWQIGYESHDPEFVHFYLQESITPVVNTPEAIVNIESRLT